MRLPSKPGAEVVAARGTVRMVLNAGYTLKIDTIRFTD